jgi:hypothetical protein
VSGRDEDDFAARIAELQARLEAQRQRVVERIAPTAGKASATAAGESLRPGGVSEAFPRSTTMRLLLEHPEWLALVAGWLSRRFGLSVDISLLDVLGVVRGFVDGLHQANPPSPETRDTDSGR